MTNSKNNTNNHKNGVLSYKASSLKDEFFRSKSDKNFDNRTENKVGHLLNNMNEIDLHVV